MDTNICKNAVVVSENWEISKVQELKRVFQNGKWLNCIHKPHPCSTDEDLVKTLNIFCTTTAVTISQRQKHLKWREKTVFVKTRICNGVLNDVTAFETIQCFYESFVQLKNNSSRFTCVIHLITIGQSVKKIISHNRMRQKFKICRNDININGDVKVIKYIRQNIKHVR